MIGWCCPLAFRPFLRYVVLICDTPMVCVWPSIVLFFPLFILLWSRKMIVRQQGSLSVSRPYLRNFQSCRRRRSLPYQIERGSKPRKTTIEGYSDSLVGIDLRILLPHCKRLLLYGLWLKGKESSLRSGNLFLNWKTTWGDLHATFARAISFFTSS